MATVSKSFTATGNGNLIFIRSKEKFTYDVSGTFVGTVRIGRSTDGGQSWKEVVGAMTAAASGTVTNDGLDTAHYMFVCTAFTSGTIVTAMVDVTTVVNSFQNTEGNTVLAINEDGIAVTGTASVSGVATLSGGAAATTLVDIIASGSGDPQLNLSIGSGTNWYVGSDNSNSDVFSIGNGTVVGTNQVLAFSTTTGYFGVTNVQFGNGVAAASQVTHSIGIDDGIHVFSGGGAATGSRLAIYGHTHATKLDMFEFYSYSSTLTGSISAAGAWTLGESGGSASHRIYGSLGIGNAAGTSANIIAARIDNAGVARCILTNGNTGAGAYARFTASSDAGDVNFDAYSLAGGAIAAIAVDSTFTGGLEMSISGAREIRLKTNSTTGLSVSGAQLVTIGTGTATVHRLNTQVQTTVGAAGAASALPATPTTYVEININGTALQIPCYAKA